MSVKYIITTDTLTFFVKGQPYPIHSSAPNFPDAVEEINKPEPDEDVLIQYANAAFAVKRQIQETPRGADYLTKGVIDVTREGVTYNGQPIHNTLAERLMDVLKFGLRIGPWIQFAENIYQNPADYAREELYQWLEGSNLPITEDGCFMAYKVVKDDYTDVYSGTFDNSVGKVVQLAGRHKVDTNRDATCSFGLHFCSKDYLPSFGANGSGRRIMMVKVNPADVVSIPSDYGFTKGRTWRYEVMEEIEYAEIDGKEWAPVADYDYDLDDEEWDEMDDEYYDDDDDVEYDDGPEDNPNTPQTHAENVDNLLDTYGIVAIRQKASNAGLNSALAWKVYNKRQLAEFVALNG